MRLEICLPLALLFLINGVPSDAQSESSVSAADATPEIDLNDDWFRPRGDFYREPLYYDVKGLLQLNCTAPGQKLTGYRWIKNGTKLSAVRELNAPAARYQLLDGGGVLRLEHAHEDDYGNYSCFLIAAGWRRDWDVRGRPVARLPPDSNVVEGQKIKIQCRIIGKPYPRVTWLYKNASSEEGNGTSLEGDARFALEDSEAGVRGGALVLLAARRGDQGRYECMPAAGDGVAAATTLRVKDMYAALWPFLGICAEVFVLCAIILVYEKRRTKPELDDSDTDNHDQKKS